jgi:hypothetical protein
MSGTTPPGLTDHDEALLQHLRELARERDAVPEHVTAAARSALGAGASTHVSARIDTEPAGG